MTVHYNETRTHGEVLAFQRFGRAVALRGCIVCLSVAGLCPTRSRVACSGKPAS